MEHEFTGRGRGVEALLEADQSEPCATTLLLVARQHLLLPHDALTEAGLKHGIPFAALYVLCDCCADYVRNRAAINGRHCVQLL